jgi:hypothetical protein
MSVEIEEDQEVDPKEEEVEEEDIRNQVIT